MTAPRDDTRDRADDDARLLRGWHAWHHEKRAAVLAKPHGPMLERLLFVLRSLELKSATVLLAYVRGVDWTAIPGETRSTVLHEIDGAVATFAPVTGCRRSMTAGLAGATARSAPFANFCFPRKRRRPGRSPV
jgi:hypothetical protein